jgi:hypothetical protein
MSSGINWDERAERMWAPIIGAPPVVHEGNLARAIVQKSVFVLLVIPKNITTGEYDPTWAHVLQHDDGSNRTVVFYNCEDAFQFAMKYIEDPWQVVEL